MEIKNRFVKESDVNYLWSGFDKKLESLSALRSSSRVCAEAFDVSGLYTKWRNFDRHIIGSGQCPYGQEDLSFSLRGFFSFFFLSVSSCYLFFSFLFLF